MTKDSNNISLDILNWIKVEVELPKLDMVVGLAMSLSGQGRWRGNLIWEREFLLNTTTCFVVLLCCV